MKVLCNLTTKNIEGFSRWDDIHFDPLTHIVLDVNEVPDMELDKLNDTLDGIKSTTDLELLKTKKLQEAITACDEELRVITSLYADAERETWAIQELEASNFQHDVDNLVTPKRATPNIDWIIEARDGAPADDVSRQALVTRILEKAYLFHSLSATAVGKRHKMTNAIDAALTIEELDRITWG